MKYAKFKPKAEVYERIDLLKKTRNICANNMPIQLVARVI